MRASEHLALCEAKRGGATAEERALCAELEAAEERIAGLIERAEFAERAKFGTPCRCESWIYACGKAEDRAEAAEARCKEMAKVVERYRAAAKRLIAVELEQRVEEARDDMR